MPGPRSVFVAGATGVIGRVLVQLLLSDGWRVFGTTRSPERARNLEACGVEPVVVDVFVADALLDAVQGTRPDAVIHQLTDLPSAPDPATMAQSLERNARLREVGTANLLRACAGTSVSRLVVQSIAFAYAASAAPHRESDPLDVDSPDPIASRTARAVDVMEKLALGAPFDAVVLRYGRLYGPGTWATRPHRSCAVHVDAAAEAARLALTRGTPGAYNVAEPGGDVIVDKALALLNWSPSFRAPGAG